MFGCSVQVHFSEKRNGLREIARQLRRLAPDHRKPEAFHETKSDLVAALIAIAVALEGLRPWWVYRPASRRAKGNERPRQRDYGHGSGQGYGP